MPPPKDPIKREEWISKIIKANLGRIPWNKDKKVELTEEQRWKIGSGNRSKPMPENTRKALLGKVPWNKGRTGIYSKETLYAMGSGNRGKKQTPEFIEKRINPRRGQFHSEETKRKIGIANASSLKGKIQSPESRQKRSEMLKKTKELRSYLQKQWWANMPIEEKSRRVNIFIKAGQSANISQIENIVKNTLNSKSINFIQQFPYRGFVIDFYLPDQNQFIECNGEYWHRLPERIRRDRVVAIRCKEDGIKLTTLWENDIRKNIDRVIDATIQ